MVFENLKDGFAHSSDEGSDQLGAATVPIIDIVTHHGYSQGG